MCRYHLLVKFDLYVTTYLYVGIDVDECLMADICSANSICNNIEGSYFCMCESGYREQPSQANALVCDGKCTHA